MYGKGEGDGNIQMDRKIQFTTTDGVMTTEYLYFEFKSLNELWFILWDVLCNVKSTLLL